ncbi:ABC transporter permease [Hansschlegelia plantiphila]|uniref:Spermidine/putrescine ABC transporter permease n=1 Tax=Hansschlegelia plantiphila TaxID=374655 RepID=A0A9W6J4Y1_9HYPH|nr:ABC transporter permease [Hansschlegelia plantiphila]GLK69876.1 spermidine/putrescine ABC transporter permease [Hansschlegelia plantiphila]
MLRAYIWIYVAFLYAPMAIITLFSFHSSPSLTFPFEGFSLRWYEKIFSDANFMHSLWNSVIVGAAAAAVTTVLGSLAALGLARMKGKTKAVFGLLAFAPVGLPGLFLGISLVILYAQIGLPRSLFTIVIAHVLFTIPFFIETMRSRVEYFDLGLEEAARDLGAGPLRTFWLVTLPIIAPTIAGAAILAFALSFDEFIITVFVSGNETTLPLLIWSMMRRAVSPDINAASVLSLSLSIGLILIGGLIVWYQRRKAIGSRA